MPCLYLFNYYFISYVIVLLDSERSDECIEFIMMCVFLFFMSVYTIIVVEKCFDFELQYLY